MGVSPVVFLWGSAKPHYLLESSIPLRNRMLLKITTLPGDGIGPEVTEQAVAVLRATADQFGHELRVTEKNVGGAALIASNDPLPKDTIEACLLSEAVLLGAVGGPAFDQYPAN